MSHAIKAATIGFNNHVKQSAGFLRRMALGVRLWLAAGASRGPDEGPISDAWNYPNTAAAQSVRRRVRRSPSWRIIPGELQPASIGSSKVQWSQIHGRLMSTTMTEDDLTPHRVPAPGQVDNVAARESEL